MKIDENPHIGSKPEVHKSKSSGPARKEGDRGTIHTSGTRTDIVNISIGSHEIKSLVTLVKAAPDTRIEKVAQLRESVESHAYQIPSDQIAESLINGE